MSEIEVLVTVKAYPALSRRYGEVVCVAGVRTDAGSPEWVRLFPVPFRDLPFDQRFQKYQFVQLKADPHSGDTRPETLRPDVDSLRVGRFVETAGDWEERRQWVEPLIVESMCWLRERQREDGTSLGAFRPWRVEAFEAEADADDWSDRQLEIAQQPSLFFPVRDSLEKIPYRFRYRWRCGTVCNGHAQSIVDWELASAFRRWRDLYDESTLLEKLREKWLDEICGPDKDTVFFVGNQHQHPESFLVLGTFWPPKERAAQQRLL